MIQYQRISHPRHFYDLSLLYICSFGSISFFSGGCLRVVAFVLLIHTNVRSNMSHPEFVKRT